MMPVDLNMLLYMLMANPELVEDGEEFIVDILQTSNAKYVDSGTGTTAPVKANTALETPTAESRDTGTQGEGGSASIYEVVATHTYAGSFAITECGLFDAATVGNLIIRGTFAAINVASSDQIEFTITLEIL
jgi:hypothetical protein